MLPEIPLRRSAWLSPDNVNVRTAAPSHRVTRGFNPCQEETTMSTGTVKWFNATKGYGFIEPEDGSKDAFVHISAVERAGLGTLREGQKLTYELQAGQNGKSSAENLTVAD